LFSHHCPYFPLFSGRGDVSRGESPAQGPTSLRIPDSTTDLDELTAELDTEITAAGMRGNVLPARPQRRHRTTRHRQDTAPLPCRKIAARTIGKTYTTPDGKTFRPSMFLTLTCPSYGRVREDGTPADPASYDYRQAARDALHFAALFDRFIQNLRRLYRYLLRCHLGPDFETRALADIQEPNVRRWRKDLLDGDTSTVTAAKAYRLLKAIMNTAVDDGLIRRNPCRIRGGGQEKSPERPVLTIAQVGALADAAGPRYRPLVLLAVFGSLRWGELAALRRCDIDIQARTIPVTRQLSEQPGGGFAFGPPKSEAGQRAVAIPEVIMPDLALHIMTHAAPGEDGLLFTSPAGGPLRHTNFRRRVWLPAMQRAELPLIHFHDLRHAGNVLAFERGRQPARADGPDGPRLGTRGPALPAWQRRAPAGHRGRAEQKGGRRVGRGTAPVIGHATGTATGNRIMTAYTG